MILHCTRETLDFFPLRIRALILALIEALIGALNEALIGAFIVAIPCSLSLLSSLPPSQSTSDLQRNVKMVINLFVCHSR